MKKNRYEREYASRHDYRRPHARDYHRGYDGPVRRTVYGTSYTGDVAVRGTERTTYDAVGGTARTAQEVLELRPVRAVEDAGRTAVTTTYDATRTALSVPAAALGTVAGAVESVLDAGRHVFHADDYEQHMFGPDDYYYASGKASEDGSQKALSRPEFISCTRARDCMGCNTCMPLSGAKECTNSDAIDVDGSKKACGCATCSEVRVFRKDVDAFDEQEKAAAAKETSSVSIPESTDEPATAVKIAGGKKTEDSAREDVAEVKVAGGKNAEASARGVMKPTLQCTQQDDGTTVCESHRRLGKKSDRSVQVETDDGNKYKAKSVTLTAKGYHGRAGYGHHRGCNCGACRGAHRPGCNCPGCASCQCGCNDRKESSGCHGKGRHAYGHRENCNCPQCVDCGCGCWRVFNSG